jgi:hypothetical protein
MNLAGISWSCPPDITHSSQPLAARATPTPPAIRALAVLPPGAMASRAAIPSNDRLIANPTSSQASATMAHSKGGTDDAVTAATLT